MAVALAARGVHVTGIESSPDRLKLLLDKSWSPSEPMCDYNHREDFDITSSMEAVRETDMSLMMVGTPEARPGAMDLSYVRSASVDLSMALREKPHALLVSSTLVPGGAKIAIQPFVAKICPVVLNPVWIAQGSVVADYLRPPVVLLGCDGAIPAVVLDFVQLVFQREPLITDTRTAETLKLAHNAWCTVRMSFINGMAEHFKATGADPRILPTFMRAGGERAGKFLQPGAPFGGPCFPRDLRFLQAMMGDSPIGLMLDEVAHINQGIIKQLAFKAIEIAGAEGTIGVVGLAYKAGSDVIEGSASRRLTEWLQTKPLLVHDPHVNGEWNGYGTQVPLDELLARSAVVIEMHPNTVPTNITTPVLRPWG